MVDSPRETPDEAATERTLAERLGDDSTPVERLEALRELGFSNKEIADAVGVSHEAVRGWLSKGSQPREGARRAVDNLRAIALLLLGGDLGLAPERIHPWFTSRSANDPNEPCPLDLIESNYAAVAAAAAEKLLRLAQAGTLAAAAHRESPSTLEVEERLDPEPVDSAKALETGRRLSRRAHAVPPVS